MLAVDDAICGAVLAFYCYALTHKVDIAIALSPVCSVSDQNGITVQRSIDCRLYGLIISRTYPMYRRECVDRKKEG